MVCMCCVGARTGLARGRRTRPPSRRVAANARVPGVRPGWMVFLSLCLLAPTLLGIWVTSSEPGEYPTSWMHSSRSPVLASGLSHLLPLLLLPLPLALPLPLPLPLPPLPPPPPLLAHPVAEAGTNATLLLVNYPLTETSGVSVAGICVLSSRSPRKDLVGRTPAPIRRQGPVAPHRQHGPGICVTLGPERNACKSVWVDLHHCDIPCGRLHCHLLHHLHTFHVVRVLGITQSYSNKAHTHHGSNCCNGVELASAPHVLEPVTQSAPVGSDGKLDAFGSSLSRTGRG